MKRFARVLLIPVALIIGGAVEGGVIYTTNNAPEAAKVEDLPLQGSISQYDITWTFEKPARIGQFVNGDWYVVGPVTVTKIDPKPLWGDEVDELIDKSAVTESKYAGKQARNGSSLNPPSREKSAGFDSRIPSGRYDPELFTHLPIAMKPGDALVSTISRRNDELTKFSGQHVDPLRVAAVLSCVAAPLPPDAFRPSYCDCANSKLLLARNLQRERLLCLPRPEGTPDSLGGYAARFLKPWLDLADFGFAAPQENLPHYGQNMVQLEGEAALLLLMDYSPEQKEPLLVNLVQVGIDLMGVARGGFVWTAHGGLNSGRKWPIVFAGIMLDDAAMQSPVKSIPGLRFAEDDQTALGPVTYRGKTFERSWTGAKAVFQGHSPYRWDSVPWEKGWGLLDVYHPSEWPRRTDGGDTLASEGYRRANTSPGWVSTALAARMMHVEEVWDHDAFFAYVDRWMTEDDTAFNVALKEAGWHDYTSVKFGEFGRQGYISGSGGKWVLEMWTAYRDNLPPAADGHSDPPAAATWQ